MSRLAPHPLKIDSLSAHPRNSFVTTISTKNDNKHQRNNDLSYQIVQQEWYRRYCDEMPQEMLFEVLRAANYMAIPPLLDLACLKVTFQLHGCNAEQVRFIAVFLFLRFACWGGGGNASASAPAAAENVKSSRLATCSATALLPTQ